MIREGQVTVKMQVSRGGGIVNLIQMKLMKVIGNHQNIIIQDFNISWDDNWFDR
jgi:hypothetical protein